MNRYLIIFLILNSFSLFAQNNKVLSKKKADAYFSNNIFQLALPTYIELLKKQPEDGRLNLKTGVCLLNSSNKASSMQYLKKAASSGITTGYYYLGQAYHFEGDFSKAIENYLLFKRYATVSEYHENNVDRLIDMTHRAMEMTANPISVRIENLGEMINSSAGDYVPVISADESILIFTSRREGGTGSQKDSNGEYFEDLYISQRSDDGWKKAVNMGPIVNTASHDAAVSLSADGQKLIIYRMSDQSYGGDLFLSTLNGNDWSVPSKIKGGINSQYWEPSGCFSADEKLFFFSSDRPGGFGGRDIYVAKKLPDNSWAVPVNLGPIVNTEYDDDAPFMHPDGKTLYFSSKGHKTMGGFDIFKTVMQNNQMWSLPENIGYPVNTVDDDIYYVLSADGTRAYYSSGKSGGYGDKDIYVIHLPEEKMALTVIKGIVHGATQGESINATITVINNNSKALQGIYRPNTVTGKYIVILPPKQSFKIVVEADGYTSWSEDIVVSETEEFTEIIKNIELKSLK